MARGRRAILLLWKGDGVLGWIWNTVPKDELLKQPIFLSDGVKVTTFGIGPRLNDISYRRVVFRTVTQDQGEVRTRSLPHSMG